MQHIIWNLIYWFGRTPWDTGVTPPELRAVVETGRVQPGRALDLGCGTGTNVIYLAEHGFDTFGVDISSRAIATARRKIAQTGHAQKAHVCAGDATQLDRLSVNGPFDLALDMGCFHSLDAPSRARYVAGLASRMRPGGLYLLYAFGPRLRWGRQMGLADEEADRLFSSAFKLLSTVHGQDQGRVGSAWYTFCKA